MTPLTTKQKPNIAATNLLEDMETTAANLRTLIVGMPPGIPWIHLFSAHDENDGG